MIWTLNCPNGWNLGDQAKNGSVLYRAIRVENDKLYRECEGIPGQTKARQPPPDIKHLKTYVQNMNQWLKDFGFQMKYSPWPQEQEEKYGMQLGPSAGEDDTGSGGGGGESKQ